MRELVNVLIVDDDGATVRNEVFIKYCNKVIAEQLLQNLNIVICTSLPSLSQLRESDVIFWDNDLGDDLETVNFLRQLQFQHEDEFNALQTKLHIVHSLNEAAADRIMGILDKDLKARCYRVPYSHMKSLVS